MDGNNWRPTQGQGQSQAHSGDPSIDSGDWRAQLQPDSRLRIVNKIMETLKRHLPFSGQEGLQELRKIAKRFEEKIYTAATSQSDYLRKISLKMLTMETKSPNSVPNGMQSNSTNSKNPPDADSQGQPLSIPIPSNQSQASQQLLSQNQGMHNSITSSGVQASAVLPSSMPSGSALPQTTMPNVLGQNPSLQSIQNISGVSQNSVGNTMGQGVPTNSFANQRQMQGRQQLASQQQQQQQQQGNIPSSMMQSQNSQQYLYHKQFQQKMMQQKLQQGNIVQSHIQPQQQQQQNLLQPNQMHPSQQSVMQPTLMQSASLSTLQQNQQPTAQQSSQQSAVHPQPVLRQQRQQQQAPNIHQQQQLPMQQQPVISTQQQPNLMGQQQQQPNLMGQQQQQPNLMGQQQQQPNLMGQQPPPNLMGGQQQQQQPNLMGQQPSGTTMQQNQLIGQQNSYPDMQQQQQQQQQRLLSQQNNLSNVQQQHLMGQPNNLSSMHQQHLGSQSSVAGLQQQQQQQLLGTQSGNSSMLTNQHSVHMLQSKVPVQQQHQQNSGALLTTQGQQSQPQMQQQVMSQLQSQPGQLQQQLNLQQQPNILQRDMQQRLQSGALLQQQNVLDQQKQLYQPQRAMPEASTSLDSTAQTTNLNSGDWQEEIYLKIKAMKEMYLTDLSELYQKITSKLQQHESAPQQQKSDQVDKLKVFKTMLERFISLIQLQKSAILPGYKDKLATYEKQIVNILNSNRPRKSVGTMQQGHALPPPHMSSVQQAHQTQPQMTQVQPLENQMSPQMQAVNLQGSMAAMQPNNMASMQHNSLSPLSGVSNAPQSMMNSLTPSSNLDPGQNLGMNSLQQVSVGSLQQNAVSGSQQVNMNPLSSQAGMSTLQPNSNMLQHQHIKQEHLLQNQHLKQFQHRQIQQQQMIQKQQFLQQQQQYHQQSKQPQQQTSHLQANQLPQLHQMADSNDMKIKQQMAVKSGAFQQHHAAGQRTAYHNQQLKPGASFPISSPQLLPAASPQISQQPSPQIDQQSLLNSLTKSGTPLQSVSSPFIVASPSTPLAPSPMPGESERVNSGVSSLTNAGHLGHQQPSAAVLPAQSLAIGTPGISASPLLAEFTSPDGNHGTVATVASGKSTVTEQPLERLLKVVKSISPKALSAAVSDIGSVVSMIDRIAGSAPGNGSRTAVGEDLIAMTKCRLQARNFVTQDGVTGTRKMKRFTSAMPIYVVSSAGSVNDSFKQLTGSEASELESTATSTIKRPRIEANLTLLEEIREINQGLIDTVVGISEEDVDPAAATASSEAGEGTVVKCTFSAVALGSNLKSQYASAQVSPIQPLRLLVPTNYPNCSPILLDKFPVEVSKEYEDLSMKAKSSFSISLRSLSQPMSLGEIAKTWDVCARAVISEYAQQSGGGSFSSKYGAWENCLSAA